MANVLGCRAAVPHLALSSRTETHPEGQQRVGYDPFAKPSANGRYLRKAEDAGASKALRSTRSDGVVG